MNLRERILTGVVGVLLVGVLGYFGVRKLYFDALDGKRANAAELREQRDKLEAEAEKDEALTGSIGDWANLTFDTDELHASAKLGSTLIGLVERAGLSQEKLSLQPVRGSRVRGAYKEIGRTIRVRGRIDGVVDFLYLLGQEPHLHRLDSLSVTPVPKTNEIDLQVRYMTLVVDAKPGEKLVTTQPTTAPADLESDERKLYNAIASRDLFRPYVRRRVVPPPRPTPRPTP